MKNLWLFDKRRLEILAKLASCDSACGCDLRQETGMAKTLLNYHMSLLVKKGFAEEKRCGREKQYRLMPAKRVLIKKVLQVINA